MFIDEIFCFTFTLPTVASTKYKEHACLDQLVGLLYIYIYIERERERERAIPGVILSNVTPLIIF